MGDLESLNEVLKGSSHPDPTRHLTDTARQVLTQVGYAIQKQQVHYINYDQHWQTCILYIKLTPTVVLWQNNLLKWIHLPVSPVKILNSYFEAVACLVQKIRVGSSFIFCRETNVVNVTYTKQ